MQRPSRKERFLFYNNMVCLVKALEGRYTTIDLRNEAYVTGKITEVDGFMNVEMEDCTFYNSRGSTFPFECFYLKGRNIRYVHIPKGLPALKLLENQIKYMSTPHPRTEINTFKKKRAKLYQREIEKDIQNPY